MVFFYLFFFFFVNGDREHDEWGSVEDYVSVLGSEWGRGLGWGWYNGGDGTDLRMGQGMGMVQGWGWARFEDGAGVGMRQGVGIRMGYGGEGAGYG